MAENLKFEVETAEHYWQRPQETVVVKTCLKRVMIRLESVFKELEYSQNLRDDDEQYLLLLQLVQRHRDRVLCALVEITGYAKETDTGSVMAGMIFDQFGEMYQGLILAETPVGIPGNGTESRDKDPAEVPGDKPPVGRSGGQDAPSERYRLPGRENTQGRRRISPENK